MTGSANIREYKALALNDHQENSPSVMFLDYFCDKMDIVLNPGSQTVFHYPFNGKSISIHDTSLVDNGASMGLIPAFADKVYKRQEGYQYSSIYGNPTVQNGTWLCTWLSGDPTNPENESVWVDRWLLSGWTPDGNGDYNTSGENITDLESSMIFEPGCYYMYDRVGNSTFNTAVSAIGTPDYLKININGTELGDVNGLTTTIQNPSQTQMRVPSVNIERTSEKAISFNGIDQSLELNYNPLCSLSGDSAIGFWSYSSDWHNIKGDSIIDNGFRGGWRFFSDKGINTKMLCFPNNINSQDFSNTSSIVWFNTEGKLIQFKNFESTSDFTALALDSDMFTWVVDNTLDINNHKNLYKIDYTGNTVFKIPLDDTYDLSAKTYTDLLMGASGAYLFFKENSTSGTGFAVFNPYDGNILQQPVLYPYDLFNSVTMDLNGSPVFSLSAFIDYDNYGSEVLPMSSETGQTCVAIDRENTRWFGYDDGYVRRFPSLSSVDNESQLFEVDTGLTSISSIEFCIEYSKADLVYKDYAYVVGNGTTDVRVVKLDSEGLVVNYLYPIDVFVLPRLKNFTSFNFERKKYYSRLLDDSVTFEFVTKNSSDVLKKYRMSKKASELSDNDWHHYGISKYGRLVSFYVDCKLEDQVLIGSDESIFYMYRNPIVIGSNVGKYSLLSEEIDVKNVNFKGLIDDFRFYNKSLSASDWFYIYMSKYDKKIMTWVYDTSYETYTEAISRWYKFKKPGHKSQYFDITIAGLNITDTDIKTEIESAIEDSVVNIVPAYTELKDINWK